VHGGQGGSASVPAPGGRRRRKDAREDGNDGMAGVCDAARNAAYARREPPRAASGVERSNGRLRRLPASSWSAHGEAKLRYAPLAVLWSRARDSSVMRRALPMAESSHQHTAGAPPAGGFGAICPPRCQQRHVVYAPVFCRRAYGACRHGVARLAVAAMRSPAPPRCFRQRERRVAFPRRPIT